MLEMTVYLPDAVLMCARRASGSWVATRMPNPLGEVLVEPIAYDPQLGRTFGRPGVEPRHRHGQPLLGRGDVRRRPTPGHDGQTAEPRHGRQPAPGRAEDRAPA